MTKLLTVNDIGCIIKQLGIHNFIEQLVDVIENDYGHWQEFKKSARHVTHFPHGVLELMPVSGDDYFAFKFVNGHPQNPALNKLTVCSVGLLADVATGYPMLLSEMTLLTALRTAATSALVAKYLARNNSQSMAMIGTGVQAEFQALAFHYILNVTEIKYFDIDPAAMKKFADNLANYDIKLLACESIDQAIENVDIITTATADKSHATILHDSKIVPGIHLNAVGGDCSGKTELDVNILKRSKIVVEYAKQSLIEGEIQKCSADCIYAELWELVQGKKPGRENDEEITLFDSVGFALEDYSTLKLVNRLADKFNLGEKVDLVPEVDDPKNLFQALRL